MRPHFVMFLSWCWVGGTFICLLMEGSQFGSAEMTILNALTGYSTVQAAGAWAIPKLAIGFFITGIPHLLMWNYSFLEGGAGIIKVFLIAVFSTGLVYVLGTMAFQTLSSLFARR